MLLKTWLLPEVTRNDFSLPQISASISLYFSVKLLITTEQGPRFEGTVVLAEIAPSPLSLTRLPPNVRGI